MLDHSILFGVVPKKYRDAKLSELDTMFAMGRGRQRDGVDVEAQEMKKWSVRVASLDVSWSLLISSNADENRFDSNYHCLLHSRSPLVDVIARRRKERSVPRPGA